MGATAVGRTSPLRILAHKPRPARQAIRTDSLVSCEPLELEYLATVLADEDIYLLDGMTDRRCPVRLARRLDSEIVLLSSLSITNIPFILNVCERLKRLPKPPWVFIGGPHAEVIPEHFCHSAVDGVFFSNQLEGIREVTARIRSGTPFDDVSGLLVRKNDRFTRNPCAPLDPSAMPIPQRILFTAAPHKYRYMHFERCASVKTAYGCPAHCIFCFCAEQHNGQYGARPLVKVVDEISNLPAENVFILDDNFLTTRARVQEFCHLIKQRGIHKRFIVYGCADFIAHNRDLMLALRDAGLAAVIVGFEFVSDRELANVHKKARIQDNDDTVRVCRMLNIDLFALFIVDPNWPSADFRRLRDYVCSRGIVFAVFATYTVFPGTVLARLVGDKNRGVKASAPGNPADDRWWRFDLLRLHQTPSHMSALRYYLWLFCLYMLPGLNRKLSSELRKRLGILAYMRLLMRSWWIGLQFASKLLVWR